MNPTISRKWTLLSLIFILLSVSITKAQITVNSDFEGGNGIATFTDTVANEVHIASELKGGDTKNIVYYVEISGLNPDIPLILEVSATWRGHNVVYSYDNATWHKALLTNLDNFIIPLTSSTVYVAHSYPYTYSDMLSDVEGVSERDHVEVFDMAVSEGGRSVKLVKVTDDCVEDAGKELIWVFGRMHAFENPGNIAVVGMLDYFVSDHPGAERLRKEAIIYVVPMMDVDMAYMGGSGKDQTPYDFNRDWLYINTPSHWNAVNAAKTWIDSTAQLNTFSVFFDSHSPPPSHGTNLFYYVYDVDHYRSNADFVTETVKEYGDYQGTYSIYGGLDISISQDYVIDNYDNPKCYNVTMETGFDYRPDGVEWTKEGYLQHGEYHGQAISDYIHGHAKTGDLLIDNTDLTRVELTGDWISDTSIFGYFGDDYLYASAQNPAGITFNATIDTAGQYEIFTRWVSDPGFAGNTSASFTHSGGTSPFSLDMTVKGGNWVLLDTFSLNAGEDVSFTINNTDADQTIIADGFRISSLTTCESVSVDVAEYPSFRFNLYPNPTNSRVNILLPPNALLANVRIYNSLGKWVLSSTAETINISSLPRGLYLVEVNTNQGRGMEKLVVH